MSEPSAGNRLCWNRNRLLAIEITNEVIAMDKPMWSKPVTIKPANAGFKTITNTEEASRFLLNHWPTRGGEMHLDARRVFIAVLSGKRRQEDARAAFIKAAQEAAILIRA
jgi:hypothetical protein